MYSFDGAADSNYVPLLASTWSWVATAKLNGVWKVTAPNPGVAPNTQKNGVPTSTFPSWHRVYNNGKPGWTRLESKCHDFE
jgi:hypothetical protein